MRKRGFTLIEMLLATALSAAMVVAVMGVTASLGRTQAALAGQAERGEGSRAMMELLRRDLETAVEAKPGNGRIEMVTLAALDPQTFEAIQRPARVTYLLQKEQDAGWLVREQMVLDDAASKPWREMVATDVSAFAIETVLPEGDPAQTNKPPAEADALPRKVRVLIERPGHPAIQAVIRTR